jgi:short-subunit dehydrogenase
MNDTSVDTERPTAMVTGASAGIGEAFARELAARHHDLVIVARSATRLEALASELQQTHWVNVEVLDADLTDPSQLAKVEARLADEQRPIDVLINNAGFGTLGDFETLDVDNEEREVRLNVLAVVRLSHAALGPMVARGRGGILNVSSIAGFQPLPQMAIYGATKAFITSFSQALHNEAKSKGVTITVLCPGFTHSEFQVRSGAHASRLPEFAWQNPPEVARAGLAALDKGKALVVPGGLNKITAFLSDVSPSALTRRVTGTLGRFYGEG